MAKKKPVRGVSRKPAVVRPAKSPESARSSARSTMSGPSSRPQASDTSDAAVRKMAVVGELAASMPENPTKAGEYGDAARKPAEGAHTTPSDPIAGGSTLTESNPSPKTGEGAAPAGFNPNNGPLD